MVLLQPVVAPDVKLLAHAPLNELVGSLVLAIRRARFGVRLGGQVHQRVEAPFLAKASGVHGRRKGGGLGRRCELVLIFRRVVLRHHRTNHHTQQHNQSK